MVFGLNTKIFEYRIRPEAFHVILEIRQLCVAISGNIYSPSFRPDHVVQDNVYRSLVLMRYNPSPQDECPTIPGPLAAVSASSPMKKSKSSVPLFAERLLPPAPPVRNEGLFATAGRPEPDPPAPPTPPLVAIAVGKTKEGESLPANP